MSHKHGHGSAAGAAAGGALIGLLLGAVAGVLFAPKSGAETRKDIKKQTLKAKKQGEKVYKDYEGRIKKAATNVKSEFNKNIKK